MKVVILILALLSLVITIFCYLAKETHSMCFFAFLTLFYIIDAYHSDIIDKMEGE